MKSKNCKIDLIENKVSLDDNESKSEEPMLKEENFDEKNQTQELMKRNKPDALVVDATDDKRDTSEDNLFDGRPITDWLENAKLKPPIVTLYSPWWNKGETCFFFGGTGLGKTIFAFQMAIEISKQYKVLFFDFELSDVQLLKRYGTSNPSDIFNENFIRFEMHKDKDVDPGKIFNEIRKEVDKEKPDVIIIDNITWILQEGQKAEKAIPFMKNISNLKKDHGVSVLIIAHTVKKKPQTKYEKNNLRSYFEPLELSDMAGSAALNNFIDSCFAIGKSLKDPSFRYLKQLKNRSDENKHGYENVLTVELVEKENGILWFDFLGTECEEQHILSTPQAERNERIQAVLRLKQQKKSNREIAKELGVSHTTVSRDLERAKNNT